MTAPDSFVDFLHNAHIFASTVREVLEEKYLRQTTDLDINLPQFNLLRLIANKGSHHMREMASFLGVSQAAASKNIDKLVRLGLVSRQVHQDDRRAVSLDLTDTGRDIIRRYEDLKEERLREVLDSFTTEELDTLTRGLEKFSFLVLDKEEDGREICMRCFAYYVDYCPRRNVFDDCIYTHQRKRAVH